MTQDPRTSNQLAQQIGQYDPNGQILYTIPGGPGQPGNTIDVNSLSEPAVDELIAKYGGQGPLIGRKSYLEATRTKNQLDNPVLTPEQEQQARLDKTQGAADAAFGKYTDNAVNIFNREQGKQRGNTIAEQIANGRSINDPANEYAMNDFNNNYSNGLQSLLGGLGAQQANANLDLSKTIEGIRNTNSENEKSRQLSRDSLTADINNATENRGLSRYLGDMQARTSRDQFGETNNGVDKNLNRALTGSQIFANLMPKKST